jgi:uncharacterized protein YggE
MRLFLILFLLVLFGCNNNGDSYIVVAGKAQIDIPIDLMYVKVDLSHQDASMKLARENGIKMVTKVLSVLEELKINDSDYVTTDYDLHKSWSYQTDVPDHLKYTLDYDLLVTLRDINQYDALLSELAEIGRIGVSIKGFGSNEIQKYSEELYRKALNNAREKADFLVEQNGQKIGGIHKMLGYSYDIDSHFDNIDETIEHFMMEDVRKDQNSIIVTAEKESRVPKNLESLLKIKTYSKTIRLSVSYYIN